MRPNRKRIISLFLAAALIFTATSATAAGIPGIPKAEKLFSTVKLTFVQSDLSGERTDGGLYPGAGYLLPGPAAVFFTSPDGAGETLFPFWTENSDLTGPLLPPGTKVKIKSNTTYYLTWQTTAPAEATLSYSSGSGEQSATASIPLEFVDDTAIHILKSPEDLGEEFVQADKTFVCWNTRPDGSGDTFAPGETLTIGKYDTAITLYAVYGSAQAPAIPGAQAPATQTPEQELPEVELSEEGTEPTVPEDDTEVTEPDEPQDPVEPEPPAPPSDPEETPEAGELEV